MYQHPRFSISGLSTSRKYDGRKAVVKNFFMLLDSYPNHPEAKSLGADGKPFKSETRGLLERAHIVANWPLIPIGKKPISIGKKAKI
jgi:hypothetical protein